MNTETRPSPVKLPLVSSYHRKQEERARLRCEEDALWNAHLEHKSAETRNALWTFYQSMVKFIAERMKTRLPSCVELGDLISAGQFGLLDALNHFEPSRGLRFSSYCVARIRGAILDNIRRNDWTPRLVRSKKSVIRAAFDKVAATVHREPTFDEVAEYMGISTSGLVELIQGLREKYMCSFDDLAAEDFYQIQFEDVNAEDPAQVAEDNDGSALDFVPVGIMRDVERLYFFEGLTMKQIGKRLGVSESRVCQIHNEAISQARREARLRGWSVPQSVA
jgi:RNA polymerase sigma factor for flagellar operon FliA